MNVDNIKTLIIDDADVIWHWEIDSTNSYAMSRKFDKPAIIIAESQSGGKGRLGRSFISPSGGLYMSIVRNERLGFSAGELTAAAAVAVMRAINAVFKIKTSIKWVNDIFLKDKKICGILCESSSIGANEFKTVVGIGINLAHNADLPQCAGAVVPNCSESDKQRLAAIIYNNYISLRQNGGFFDEYRDNCFVLGKKIEVRRGETDIFEATAVALNSDFSLVVKLSDGERVLNFGEVSVIAQE